MTRLLALPAPIVSPYFATTAILAVAIFCYSFFFAVPTAHAEGLSPKQLNVVQGLLSTYGVSDNKIKAVSAVLLDVPPPPGDHGSTTLRMPGRSSTTTPIFDTGHSSSTRPIAPPPRPATSTPNGRRSSAGSVLQFVADYSDSFNDNLAAVLAAPYGLFVQGMTSVLSSLGVED